MEKLDNIWEQFLLPLIKKMPNNDNILVDGKIMIKIFDNPIECMETLDDKKIITDTFIKETEIIKKLVHKIVITEDSKILSFKFYVNDNIYMKNKFVMKDIFNMDIANELAKYMRDFNYILTQIFYTLQESSQLIYYQMSIGEMLNEFDYINNLTSKINWSTQEEGCLKCSCKNKLEETYYASGKFIFCKGCITKGIKCSLNIDAKPWTTLQYLSFNCPETNIICDYCRDMNAFHSYVPHCSGTSPNTTIICIPTSLCIKCFIGIWKNVHINYNIITEYSRKNNDILIDLVKLKGKTHYKLIKEIYKDHFPPELICYICELMVNLDLFCKPNIVSHNISKSM